MLLTPLVSTDDGHGMSVADFPRYPLTFGPSPLHPLDRLSEHLGGPPVWAKREDCNSGLAYGGNKTRKLEYLVPDALAQGADTLVSIGGVQSNHTRQVAAVAAKLGLKARLMQENWVDWPDSVNDRVGNILLSRIMGAQVELVARRLRHRVQIRAGSSALDEVRSGGGARTRSRPVRPTTPWAAWGSRTGPTRSSSKSSSSGSTSTRSSCAP